MSEWNIPHIASLVTRVRQNDMEAFGELYAITHPKVYNFTRHYLRDDYLAQDAMQEVYILALQNLDKLNNPTLFVAWLNRISFNICYDMSKRLLNASQQVSDPDILNVVQDDYPDYNPEERIQRQEELERLNQALDAIPEQEKHILVMRYYNNMKLDEIAAAYGVSRSTVKRHLASGIEHLQQLLK